MPANCSSTSHDRLHPFLFYGVNRRIIPSNAFLLRSRCIKIATTWITSRSFLSKRDRPHPWNLVNLTATTISGVCHELLHPKVPSWSAISPTLFFFFMGTPGESGAEKNLRSNAIFINIVKRPLVGVNDINQSVGARFTKTDLLW
jgi:hypothetical protein